MTDQPPLSEDPRTTHDAPAPKTLPSWRWLTFPVYFAFAAGLLVASLLNAETDSTFEGVVQIAALLLFGYGLAHLIITNVVVAGRMRRRQQRGEQDEGISEEWEDEVVYPDEAPPRS